jgi:hypothetical protein
MTEREGSKAVEERKKRRVFFLAATLSLSPLSPSLFK